jgi:hypothetical protein
MGLRKAYSLFLLLASEKRKKFSIVFAPIVTAYSQAQKKKKEPVGSFLLFGIQTFFPVCEVNGEGEKRRPY